MTLLELIREDMRLSTFSTALDLSTIREKLRRAPELTVFAPTNTAFARLDQLAVAGWFHDPQRLRAILGRHLARGSFSFRALSHMETIETLSGDTLAITVASACIRVGLATISNCDLTATNGVLHLVDTVLEASTPSTGTSVRSDY